MDLTKGLLGILQRESLVGSSTSGIDSDRVSEVAQRGGAIAKGRMAEGEKGDKERSFSHILRFI